MNSPALIYNAEIRNNGTARRVTESFSQMGFLDTGMKRYNRPWYSEPKFEEHDFWLFIDDGRDDIPMPELPSPNACWLVDTHLGYETRKKWASQFDYAFLCQMPDVKKMRDEGVDNVYWLPLACLPCVDPTSRELGKYPEDLIGPLGLEKQHNIVFVGHLNEGDEDGHGNNRIDYLHEVFSVCKDNWLSFGVFMEQAAIRYARGRVGFNVSIKDDLNMRFFETLSYGTCLLTNRDVVGWEELGFAEGEHFVGYEGLEEAREKAKWCLENPMEREKIAKAGHELVRAEHTYQHRIEQMLETMGV